MRDDLKLYVRGFFGSKAMASETYQTWRARPILSVFDLSPEAIKHVVADESVVEIYNQMIRRQVIHTDFEFRERAIKIALRAFGVNNFTEWARINQASPLITQTHADFITDTIRFIVTGKRHMPVGMWERLIGPGSNDPSDKPDYDEVLLAMLPTGYSFRHQHETTANLHNVIAKWLSHPGGFVDMVTSLYTFFGEHNTR
ncbi:putative virion structural protein [Ralstonia phage RP31]|uniref:Putative virion structural protein n=2 Tax=Ripduovirus RP12 TaxID=2560700 RepID=A0A1L7N167_9CAUD|nr:virion structural protein [Ralstonia phage RP12]BAW19216.1 putative virion structural protein [Ralstonia phage RP12]BAW19502.1 putative virion structural protein [Ralstonia phage RP31]